MRNLYIIQSYHLPSGREGLSRLGYDGDAILADVSLRQDIIKLIGGRARATHYFSDGITQDGAKDVNDYLDSLLRRPEKRLKRQYEEVDKAVREHGLTSLEGEQRILFEFRPFHELQRRGMQIRFYATENELTMNIDAATQAEYAKAIASVKANDGVHSPQDIVTLDARISRLMEARDEVMFRNVVTQAADNSILYAGIYHRLAPFKRAADFNIYWLKITGEPPCSIEL